MVLLYNCFFHAIHLPDSYADMKQNYYLFGVAVMTEAMWCRMRDPPPNSCKSSAL